MAHVDRRGGGAMNALASAAAAPAAGDVITALRALRALPPLGPNDWTNYADNLRRLCRAQAVWLLLRTPGPDWGPLGRCADAPQTPFDAAGAAEFEALTVRAAVTGHAACSGRTARGDAVWWACVRLPRVDGGWALLQLPERERGQLNELLLRAQLVADLPVIAAASADAVPPSTARPAVDAAAGPPGGHMPAMPHRAHASSTLLQADDVPTMPRVDDAPATPQVGDAPATPRAATPQVGDAPATPRAATPPPASDAPAALAALIDLTAQVMQAERFGAAALTLVNALAAHCGAVQAVLGWREPAGMQAVAISHLERFDRRSHHAALTEDALDEALDEDGPTLLLSDEPPGARAAHALLRDELDGAHLLSLPLARGDAPPQAVLLLAFRDAPPAPGLAGRLRPALELMLPWLAALHTRERPWALRLRDGALASLDRCVGPERPLVKALAAVFALFVLYALLASWDYRVHAGGQMATDSTRLISAQFDGRVEEALVNAGDVVHAGQRLALLDTRDLRQLEIDARGEVVRYAAEADKARAAGALAELEIASARQAQAQARLTRVQDQLRQAVQAAPFDGVVVEGERKELQGTPVKKGDKLYRIARIEGLYAVLQVGERDAALVRPGAGGELTLVGRTEESIPLKVLSVVPVAQTKGQEGNHFLVRAELTRAPQAWWRPGMSGAVRIDAGERRVAWILTHRLVDAVRLALWW